MNTLESVWAAGVANHKAHSEMGTCENNVHFLALGLCGEAGELANFVKKRWRDGQAHTDDIKLEIADVCAYAFMLADEMGMGPQDLLDWIAFKQQRFIEKMENQQDVLDRIMAEKS